MAGTCCNFATQLKYIFGYDDTLDVRAYYFFLPFVRFCFSTLSWTLGIFWT
jgi:hypothetical protein